VIFSKSQIAFATIRVNAETALWRHGN